MADERGAASAADGSLYAHIVAGAAFYLVNTLLRDTDAMSMRHSLEVRVPFLDAPLVEYVLGVPESLKGNAGRPKSLLIDAMKDLLPAEVVAQNKRTFTFPWETWLAGIWESAWPRGWAIGRRRCRRGSMAGSLSRFGGTFCAAGRRGRVPGACTC